MPSARGRNPFAQGGALALVAACAFGATTPLVQRFGTHVGPFATAAILYVGAAIASGVPLPGAKSVGTPMRASHLPRLLLVALAGALVAPVCLAWGVQRTSAVGASLLLNLEGLFTVLLARAFYREPIGPRVGRALLAMGAGGALLVLMQGSNARGTTALGALAVAGATLAWAADNTLTRPLSELEPSRVVLVKGLLGASLAVGLAVTFGEGVPALPAVLGLLACGATGYGASLRLYLAAQRRLGAARTASIFAAAPFVGAVVAVGMGDRPPVLPTVAAASLCAFGVWLHLTERHSHAHSHASVHHEHAHRHDDGHHAHVHEPAILALGEQSHPHTHDPITHEHEHAPDVHHGHGHG